MEKAPLNRLCFGPLQARFFYPLLEGAGLPVNFLPGGSGNFPGPPPGADRFALRPIRFRGLAAVILAPVPAISRPSRCRPGIFSRSNSDGAPNAPPADSAVCILAAGLGKGRLFGVLSLCRFPLPRLALLGGESARRENPQFAPLPDPSFRFLPRCQPSCPAFAPAAGSAGFPGERRPAEPLSAAGAPATPPSRWPRPPAYRSVCGAPSAPPAGCCAPGRTPGRPADAGRSPGHSPGAPS